MNLPRSVRLYAETRPTEGRCMRKMTFGMKLSRDGHIAAPGDNLGSSVPSNEPFGWWSDRVGGDGPGAVRAQTVGDDELALGRPPTSSLAPHRRRSSSPAAGGPPPPPLAGHAEGGVLLDDQHGRLEHPTGHRRRRHRDHPAQDRGRRSHGRRRRHPRRGAYAAGLIDQYAIVTPPVLVGGGTPFFTALDNWVNPNPVETRTFPDDVLLTRYQTRR